MSDQLKNKYLAFVLDEKSREKLIKAFPPTFDKVICHHVTLEFFIQDQETIDKFIDMTRAVVVGYISDEALEALVVSFGAKTTRDDGSIYHITHSLTSGKRKPFDSNKLLKQKKYIDVPHIAISGTVELEDK